jgi:hypothetical protein
MVMVTEPGASLIKILNQSRGWACTRESSRRWLLTDARLTPEVSFGW